MPDADEYSHAQPLEAVVWWWSKVPMSSRTLDGTEMKWRRSACLARRYLHPSVGEREGIALYT